MAISLRPDQWGLPMWKMLTGIAFGVKDTYGNQPLPAEIVTLFSALGGVLPCAACRASYHKFTRELLLPRGSSSSSSGKTTTELLSQLVCADLPKFVYELHNKVNDKLDTQWFSKKIPALARELGIPKDALATALKATRFCEGRRPSWETVETSHSIFSLKCVASDVLSVLFMLAMAYPDYTTTTTTPAKSVDTTRSPEERRRDFDALLEALPQAMRQSGCGDNRLADILHNTWDRCTTGECKYDLEHMDDVITAHITDIRKKRQAHTLTHTDMFMFVWVLRARYKEGTCSSSKDVAIKDVTDLRDKYARAR